MSARPRSTAASTRSAAQPRPTAAAGPDGRAANDPLLVDLRGRLQEALEELEEQRAAGETLHKLLETAEQRVAQLESGAFERLRSAAGDGDAQRSADEFERLRAERMAAAERARSEDARRLANAEKRLRSAEATLSQTLQALEEHRVTAVEQLMMAEATEHHATGLEQEVRRRVERAEALAAESQAALTEALQTSEERRILAAEMQTILEATEYRLSQIEKTAATAVPERNALQKEVDDLRASGEQLRVERASTTTALERTMAELALQRDIAAGLGIERDAALEQAEGRARIFQERESALAELRQRASAAETAAEAARRALEQATADAAAQREAVAQAQQDGEAARAALQKQISTSTDEIAARTTTVATLEARVATLSQEKTQLGEQLSSVTVRLETADGERVTLQDNCQRLTQQIEAIETQGGSLAAQLAQVTDALAAARAELSNAQATDTALQSQVAGLEQTLAQRSRALETTSNERDQMRVARDTLTRELEAAQARIAQQSRIAETLEQQGSGVARELADARAAAEQLNAELQRTAGELDEHKRAAAAATGEHHAVVQHLREIEEALGRREHDLEELHATLTRERDEWTAARSELLTSLEREGGAQQELVAARQSLEERLHAIETELHTERDRATRLNEERAQGATALSLLREELKTQLEALAVATGERDGLAERLRTMEAATADAARRLEESGAAHQRAESVWKTVRSELESAVATAKSRIDTAMKERDDLAGTLDRERAARTQVDAQRQQVENDLRAVRGQLAESEARLKDAAAQQTAHIQAQAQLEKRLAETEQARVSAVNAATQARLDHAKEQATAQEELAQLKRQLKDSSDSGQRSERAVQEVRAKAADLERQVGELHKAREAALRAQAQLTESLRGVGDQRSALERQVAELEKARDGALQEHAQTVKALGERTEQVGASQRRIAELEQARDAAVREHAQGAQALRESGEQRSKLERQIGELEKAREAAARAQTQLAQSLSVAGDQRAALERQVAELTQQHEAGRRAQDETTQSLRAEAQQRQDLERQVAELQAANQAAAVEQQSAAAELAQLQAEIGRLGEARTVLQQRLQDAQTQLAAEQDIARELRDLQAHGTELYQLVEADLQQTRTAGEATAKQMEELRQSLEGRERDLARLQAALADAERRHGDGRQRTEQLTAELTALTRTRDELQQRVDAWSDRDRLAARATELERAVAQADAQATALRGQLTETQDQLHAAMQQMATATAAAADVAALQAQLVAREAEGERLQRQVENLSEQRDVLQRERDQLKRRSQDADDADRVRAEQQRLLEKLAELERQQTEATQRHSAAVSGYMVELNQRSEMLRQRDLVIERLSEEMRVAQKTCDDGVTHMGGLRQERDLLELRVRELESVAAAPRPAAAARPGGDSLRLSPSESAPVAPEKAAAAAPKAPTKAPAPAAKPAASAKTATPTSAAAAATAAPASPAPPAAAPTVIVPPAAVAKGLKPSRNATGVLNVVHLEDVNQLCEAVRTSVGRYSRVKYMLPQDAPATVESPTLLTINLLVKSIDPLVTLSHADAWGLQTPQAFAYCADGTRGSIIGLADFFPHPFDLDACAARISDRPGGTQRLLVVGESVELLNEIRSAMNRIRCSTSVALDARQAFDLLAMVKPQAVLIDVGLQRAEGLRLVARLRSDPAYAGVRVGFMWTRDIEANEFRMNVARAGRDTAFSTDDLGRQISQTVADLGFTSEELRDAG